MASLRFAPESPNEPAIAGNNAATFVDTMRQLYGLTTITALLGALPSDVREELEFASTRRWVRISLVDELVRAIARETPHSYDEVWDALVRTGSQRWFRLVWRVLLNLASDEGLLSRAAMIYAKARNVGAMQAKVKSPGNAELELTGWPEIPERQARNFCLAIENILEAAGRKEAHCLWERSPDGALYLLTWKAH